MPPIKGRMISRMGRMGGQTGSSYAHLRLGMPKKRPKFNLKDAKHSSRSSEEKFRKLRYPPSISRILPSVKRFKGTKGFVDLTDETSSIHSEDSEIAWEDKPLSSNQILGIKRSTRGLVTSKYFVKPVTEEKFTGMIWDIAFSPNGDILVSCGEGILLCDYDLRMKSKLEHITLAGGISFLADGKIVAVCRNTDTVNIYTPSGTFLRSFSAGFSPMAIEATPEDKLIICDPGSKCIRIFDVDGIEEKTVGPVGKDFKLRWPLYASMVSTDTFLVSDCHSQSVLHFNVDGEYMGELKMNISGGNKVLRPHGVCVHENSDVFVIDMATDTVEIFSEKDTFIQTLIPQDEGHYLRPKIVRLGGRSQNYMAIGGLVGIVKLYEFVSEEEVKPKKTPVKTPSKPPARRGRISNNNRKKLYMKEEPEPALVKEEVILCDDDDEEDDDDIEIKDELDELERKIENQLNGNDEEITVVIQESREVVENHINEHDPVVVEDSDVSEDEEEEELDEGSSLMIIEDKEDDIEDTLMIDEDKEEVENKVNVDVNEDGEESLLMIEEKSEDNPTLLLKEDSNGSLDPSVVTAMGEYSFLMEPILANQLPLSPEEDMRVEPLIVLDD